MIRIGVVGLGKMGLSHLSILNAHPDVAVVGVADTSSFLRGVLSKYTALSFFSSLEEMLDAVAMDAVFICTPSVLHAGQVRQSLDRGLHVFCEKPLCLDPAESAGLAALAADRGLVTQVGYHNRYVGAFREMKRLLDIGAIGRVSHVLAEAYGPVVLKAKGATWRSQRQEGGGCLYDYAAHPLDLLNWYFGAPVGVAGTALGRTFSGETEDEVASTLFYPGGMHAQLSVSWSDPSQRKMSTKITAWGTGGRIFADRQEIQVYLRESGQLPAGYSAGWNVRYANELTEPVRFYVRGEEYSAQIDAFVSRVGTTSTGGESTFATAALTDAVIDAMASDASRGPATRIERGSTPAQPAQAARKASSGLRRLFRSR